jgi:hypothetical protein
MLDLERERWSRALSEQGSFKTRANNKSFAHALGLVAQGAGKSLPKMCSEYNSYQRIARFSNNQNIEPKELSDSACVGTCSLINKSNPSGDLLIISDTTDLSWKHSAVSEDLRDTGYTTGKNDAASGSSLIFHTALAFNPQSQEVIGLVEQVKISRSADEFGKKHSRKSRPYEEKESYKWQQVTEKCWERLLPIQKNLIFVHDREADIYEYMQYLFESNLRFIIRAEQSRKLLDNSLLMESFDGTYFNGLGSIWVEQKGGRPARTAQLEFRATEVVIRAPARMKDVEQLMSVNLLNIKEVGVSPNEKPIEWTLLTTEPIGTAQEIQKIAYYYASRWVIEEFHKCWKSGGCNVEALRLEKVSNLERMSIVMAHSAVKIMQVRDNLLKEDLSRRMPEMVGITKSKSKYEEVSCEGIVPEIGWKLLWLKYEKSKPIPADCPSRKWLMNMIARLGGWMNTGRTGRPGYTTLWDGWGQLENMIETARLLQSLRD